MLTSTEIARLNGATVLVRTRSDHHNPPTAVRGTIVVEPEDSRTQPRSVRIALSYPSMFMKGAHEKILNLDEAALEELLASERNGAFEWTTDESLDP